MDYTGESSARDCKFKKNSNQANLHLHSSTYIHVLCTSIRPQVEIEGEKTSEPENFFAKKSAHLHVLWK